MRIFAIQFTIVALLATSLAFVSALVPIGSRVASASMPPSALGLQVAASIEH